MVVVGGGVESRVCHRVTLALLLLPTVTHTRAHALTTGVRQRSVRKVSAARVMVVEVEVVTIFPHARFLTHCFSTSST